MKSNTWQFSAYGMPDDVLQWVEQDLPPPEAGQALVKLTAIGMNRSDLNYTQQKYMPAKSFPSALGQEAVGEIVAVGEPGDAPVYAGTALKPGTRVALTPGKVDMCGTGTYRDYGIYDQSALIPIPEGYTDTEGASFWMGALTVGGCFHTAGLTAENAAGKTVLITAAASGMGVMALKLARAWGAKTIGTTRSTDKVAGLQAIADHVLVCSDGEELAAGLGELGGFDVAIDPVGMAFIPTMVDAAAHGASIVSYEMITGGVANYAIAQLLIKEVTLTGFALFNIFRHPGLCEQLVDQGLKYAEHIRPIVAETFALSNAPSTLVRLGSAQHFGKLVLLPDA